MGFDDFRHHRHSVRFLRQQEARSKEKGHGRPCPYDVGVFYVTICTHQRECLFGSIVDGVMQLSPCGEIVRQEWFNVAGHRPNVTLDAFVAMPNHIHGIFIIRRMENPGVKQEFKQPVAGTLPMVVGGFKSAVSRRINELRGTPGAPVWQRGYHDKIAHDERMLNNARRYIANNPTRWPADTNNPVNITTPD